MAIGTFEGAVNPETQTFGQWADFVDQRWGKERKKKVAMFCTGGIRCEKASLYKMDLMKCIIKGGILNYLEKIDSQQSKWNGECFVFDHGYLWCMAWWTGIPSSASPADAMNKEDYQSPEFEEGVSCPRCASKLSPEEKKACAAPA